MSEKSKPMMLRVPKEHFQQFQQLRDEFGGLPPATILRMILVSFLEMPFDDQLSGIERQVKGKKGTQEQPPMNRVEKLNRNTRHQ